MVRQAGFEGLDIEMVRRELVDRHAFAEWFTAEGAKTEPIDHHPGLVRTRGDSGNLDAPCRQLDDEEHMERHKSTRPPDLHREEVGCSQHRPMGLEKLAPGDSFAALRRWLDPVLLQDTVLLAQIINRRLLVLVDSVSEDRDQELPWLEDLGHPVSSWLIPGTTRLFFNSAQG